MQQALTRIPAEVTSTLQLEEIENNSVKRFGNEVQNKSKKKSSLYHNEIETVMSGIPEQTTQKASLNFDLENLILNGFPIENKHSVHNVMELPVSKKNKKKTRRSNFL